MLFTTLLLLACTGSKESAPVDSSKNTDSQGTTDTGPTDSTPLCESMTSGEDWAWEGECPQMTTPCEIVVTGCGFTIGYSSGMTMGMPSGGSIAGTAVSFTGGSVRGCEGTLEDADHISGSCASGCTFTLSR